MNNTKITDLLKKLETESITPEEMDLLRAWSQDPDLYTHYDSIKSQKWEELKSKLPKKEEAPVRKLKPTKLWPRVAAVFLVLLASIYTFQLVSSEEMITIYAQHEKQTIDLPDGSAISLSKGSTLAYNEDFGKKRRSIKLDGEAYFDVERDPNTPFVIDTESSTTTVLGTAFYLSEIDQEVVLDVVEGKVKLDLKSGNDYIKIKDEYIAIDVPSNRVLSTTADINKRYWNTGKLLFDNTPLVDALKEISTLHKTDISYDQDLTECKLNSTFEGNSIEDILDIIAITFQATWQKEKDNYILTQITCK